MNLVIYKQKHTKINNSEISTYGWDIVLDAYRYVFLKKNSYRKSGKILRLIWVADLSITV